MLWSVLVRGVRRLLSLLAPDPLMPYVLRSLFRVFAVRAATRTLARVLGVRPGVLSAVPLGRLMAGPRSAVSVSRSEALRITSAAFSGQATM